MFILVIHILSDYSEENCSIFFFTTMSSFLQLHNQTGGWGGGGGGVGEWGIPTGKGQGYWSSRLGCNLRTLVSLQMLRRCSEQNANVIHVLQSPVRSHAKK